MVEWVEIGEPIAYGTLEEGIAFEQSRLSSETVRDFGTGTRGFAASDATVAVCVLPGTELAFAHEVERLPTRL